MGLAKYYLLIYPPMAVYLSRRPAPFWHATVRNAKGMQHCGLTAPWHTALSLSQSPGR